MGGLAYGASPRPTESSGEPDGLPIRMGSHGISLLGAAPLRRELIPGRSGN